MVDDDKLNHELDIPTETNDYGSILRQLRLNHGWSIARLSKRLGWPTSRIAAVERGTREVPTEQDLRKWLTALGCKRNIQPMIMLARQFRVTHYLKLIRGDESNRDMIRLLELYRTEKLTELDRHLLLLIGRDE